MGSRYIYERFVTILRFLCKKGIAFLCRFLYTKDVVFRQVPPAFCDRVDCCGKWQNDRPDGERALVEKTPFGFYIVSLTSPAVRLPWGAIFICMAG